ncbi:MAG: UvrB/UvrC motif-containing protein [Candidatus Omnitrophica bacterium]|nr:UvrB/UvrC motif-containing protein [Candidatus Omnitrophota bacterium]
MPCDICGKNPATVHLTEIIDNQMTELHLCEECAHQKSVEMEQQFGLSDLLAGMADFEKPAREKKAEMVSLKCPGCGLTYADFKKMGRLGCGGCYAAFKKYLAPLIKRIHGSILHFGKTPFKKAAEVPQKKTDLQSLRQRLQRAIEEEAFEEAARIRDQIRELEKKENEHETR